jgi:hypothetical protein
MDPDPAKEDAKEDREGTKRDPLTDLASILGIIVAATTLGPLFASYLLNFVLSDLQRIVMAMVAICALAGWIAVAYVKMNSPTQQDEPFPAAVWRLVFRKVATPAGELSALLTLIIVHDEDSEKLAEQVKGAHGKQNLDTPLVKIDPASPDTPKRIPEILKGADAVYFFWTDKILSKPNIGRALDSWALAHKSKPVLVVNTIPEKEFPLKFKCVSPAGASSGLLSLLVQASDRALLWDQLALALHRAWLVTFAVSVVGTVFSYSYYKNHLEDDRIMVQREQQADAVRGTNALTAVASIVVEALRRSQPSDTEYDNLVRAFVTTRTDLSAETWRIGGDGNIFAAREKLNGFLSQVAGMEPKVDELSFFRRTQIGQRDALVQIAWSKPHHEPAPFHTGPSSVVGCSVDESAFVLWTSPCVSGSVAAWASDGKKGGVCSVDETKGLVGIKMAKSGTLCRFQSLSKERTDRTALFCFSPPAGGRSDTAVCFEMHSPFRNGLFADPAVRAKIRMISLLAALIPTDAILTEGDRERFRKMLLEQDRADQH